MYIAVLIDAENVDPAYAEQIFTYANSIGTVAVKEIYGAGIALNEWANPILQYAIHMNMTLKPNRYKNSSDIALVIGAMDLLAERAAALPEPAEGPEGRFREVQLRNGAPRRIDTIIIASSDSDFSGLSLRLRMAGFEVVGMGNAEKINPSWPVACSSFVAFTPVEHAAQPAQPAQRKPQAPKKEPQPVPPAPKKEQPPAQTVKKEPAPAQNVKKEPEKGQPQQAAQPKVAPTHSARTEIIRAFITAQIASSGGKLHSTTLLGALHELPDYRYDQQGSKRKPLDYLLRQYGDSFKFEKDPGGFYWIYPPAPPEAKSAEAAPQSQPAAEPAAPAPEPPAAPEAAPPAPEQPAEPEKAQEQAAPAPEAVPASEAAPSPAAAFIAAGVPEEDALKIAAIRSEGPNLRVVYNNLRKQFGDADGRKYYQLLKDLPEEAAAE